MSDFISDPLRNFLDAHARLNDYIKVSTAAVDFLKHSTTDEKELSARINQLILDAGERWTSKTINKPYDYLSEVRNDLSKSAVINVYSAFDIFLSQVSGHMSEHANKELIADSDDVKEVPEVSRITNFYKKLNWEITTIRPVLPVFRFYKVLRNCVAHNMGLANAALIAIANSAEFEFAIKTWKTKFPKKTISSPPVILDKAISLDPHHAITYSDACLRIARDMNLKMFGELGLGYFIDKTLKKHLSDPKKLTEPKCSDLVSYIKCHLKLDYNIATTKDDINAHFNDWKIKKVYKQQYKNMAALAL